MTQIYNPQWDEYMTIDTALVEFMKKSGYAAVHTGGGCMSWERVLDDGGTIGISAESALGGMEYAEQLVWYVCRHDVEGDGWVQIIEPMTLADALRIAALLPAPSVDDPYRDMTAAEFPAS